MSPEIEKQRKLHAFSTVEEAYKKLRSAGSEVKPLLTSTTIYECRTALMNALAYIQCLEDSSSK